MSKGKASQTALKVAMNTLTLSAKPGMAEIIPPGFVDVTEKLLEASGVINRRTLRWARSPKMVAVYEAFDWGFRNSCRTKLTCCIKQEKFNKITVYWP